MTSPSDDGKSMDNAMAVASRLMTGKCYPYIYEVGYGSYEESEYWQLSHKKKFTKEELHHFVVDAFFAALEAEAGAHKESGFGEMYTGVDGPKFQDLMRSLHFLKYLESLGFVQVEYAERFNIFGWASCLDPKDWEDNASPVRQAIAKELHDRCKEAGIYVEPFEVEKEPSERDYEREFKEKLEKDPNITKEEVRKMVKKYRTYYRLSKKETTDGGADTKVLPDKEEWE
jgi:hypothetical protein